MITPAFSAEFREAMDAAKGVSPNEGFQRCIEVIDKHNMWYEFEGTADNFLVHTENRSKLMLNPTKAHRVGDQVHHAGADFKQLDAAYAFELSKVTARRAFQIKKNEEVVERSSGLLAKVNYKERFITVGTSHLSQFCKQAMIAGKTPMPKLQDRAGRIDIGKLKANPSFAKMLEKGWKWKIFYAELDDAFPDFAKLAQRALNASNSIRQDPSEIELACQVAEFYKSAENDGHPNPKEAAIAAVQEGGSVIQGYASILFDFGSEYGGGADLPFLRLIDNHAKARGTSKPLGSAFWNQIMNLKFYSDPKLKLKNVRPSVRLSLVCLQSCMTASRDGIATFMVDYDLTKATSKDMAKDADAVEDMIGHAFKLAECLDKEFMTRFVQPIGNLLMRCALKLVGKEKQAFDGINRTMDELKALYLTDMSKIVGSKVEYDNWPADVHVQANIDESSQPSGANQKKADHFKTLGDFCTIEGQAAKHGFRLGDFVSEKGFDSSDPCALYTILSFTSDAIHLQKAFDYSSEAVLQRISVSLETLLARWFMKPNVKLPVCISQQQLRPASIDIDKLKCQVFEELLKVDKAHSKHLDKQGVAVWSNPACVISSRKIPCGELTLVPFVPMSNISTKKPSSGRFQRVHEDPEMYLVPLSFPSPEKGKSCLDTHQLCVAYWHVSETSNEANANMTEIVIEKGQCSFKCLTNNKDIEAFAPLLVYKPPANVAKIEKHRLEGATVIGGPKRQRVHGKQGSADAEM